MKRRTRTIDPEAWRLGPLAFRDRVEPILRAIVSDHMGFPADDLLPDVSFEHDLSARPSDVTDLVVVIERAVGMHLTEDVIDRLRTYGDLVDAVANARGLAEDPAPPRMLLRTVLISGRRDRRGVVVRSSWSTPYALTSIADEARRAGPGACLVVNLPADVSVADAAYVERAFEMLPQHDVQLRVHRDHDARGRAVA